MDSGAENTELPSFFLELGDRKQALKLLAGYLDALESNVRELVLAVSRGESREILRLAHAVRGGALNVDGADLAQAAHEVERSGGLADAKGIATFLVVADRRIAHLRALLAPRATPGSP